MGKRKNGRVGFGGGEGSVTGGEGRGSWDEGRDSDRRVGSLGREGGGGKRVWQFRRKA